jgi:hypothetical protein
VFPFAQTWIHDDAVGREQIAADRVSFNTFVNADHASQLKQRGLEVRTVQVPTRDGAMLAVHLYQSPLAARVKTDHQGQEAVVAR